MNPMKIDGDHVVVNRLEAKEGGTVDTQFSRYPP